MAVLFVVVVVAAYAIGRLWIDGAGPVSTSPAARTASEKPSVRPKPPRAALRLPLVPPHPAVPAPPSSTLRPDPTPSDDVVLLEMMTEHHDAMLMIREALDDDIDGLVHTCGGRVEARTVCWLRFHVELDGQFMRPRLADVTCDDSSGPQLPTCLRDRLAKPREPLGVPREAADELGDYSGPLDVAFAFSPKGR